MWHRSTLLSLIVLAGACRAQSVSTNSDPGAESRAARASRRAAVTPPMRVTPAPLGARPTRTSSTRGAPHVGTVEMVVLAIDRPAALTQGSLGDIRLWTALDGTVEPIAVPVQGARSLALASHEDGWRVAIVDTAGAAQLWHYHPRMGFAQLFATSPHRANRQLVILPGGRHAIALGRDHSLALLSDRGQKLASLDARGFRPMQIQATRDRQVVIALSTRFVGASRATGDRLGDGVPTSDIDAGPSDHEVVVSSVRIRTAGAPSLTLVARTELAIKDTVGGPRVAISADGRRVVFARLSAENPQQVDLYAVALPAGAPRLIARQLPTGRQTGFGFIDDRALVVVGSPEGRGWRIDTAATTGASEPDHIQPIATGASSPNAPAAYAWGQGRLLTGSARWLHVQQVAGGGSLYLGYRGFSPISAAFSPGGKYILWVSNDNVAYVEPLADARQPVSIFSPTGVGRLTAGVFIDEDHVALIDGNGRLSLVAHRTGELRATADSGGVMGQRITYDPKSQLLSIARGARDVWLYRVDLSAGSRKPFSGPYILHTENTIRSGFLRAAGRSVFWTLDQKQMYRTYSLDEIRSNMSYRTMLKRGRRVSWPAPNKGGNPNTDAPIALDLTGRRYYADGNRLVGYPAAAGDQDPPRTTDARVSARFDVALNVVRIARLEPSPDGHRFAILHSPNNVQVFPDDAGKRLWSYTLTENINDFRWSDDGSMLALVASSGGLVLDAATGSPVHRACGLWFDPRVGAPYLHTSAVTAVSTCGP